MIIHATFTNGYFGFSKLWLKSFQKSNGSKHKVVFTTSDLRKWEIDELKVIYKNLTVHNKEFDYGPICKSLGITQEEIMYLKYKVEHEHAKQTEPARTKWKMHVAAENRVKIDIPFMMKEYKNEGLIAHFDIDMYFKKPLGPLFKLMKDNDFTVMYRPRIRQDRKKIWMCAMGIKTNSITAEFFREWGKELDKVPLKDKPFSFGQIAGYYAYKTFLKDKKIKFGNIPEHYISDGLDQHKDALIISGNTGKIHKDESLEIFNKDFLRRNNE